MNPEEIRLAATDTSFLHQLGMCLLGAPIGGGLLGLIAAKKGQRGPGLVYGTVAKALACPVAAGITSTVPGLAGFGLSSLLQFVVPIAASYYLTRR